MISINYFAIILAAIVGFAIGGLWYSPALFGRRWAALMWGGEGGPTRSAARAAVFEFLATLLMAYVLGEIVLVLSAFTFLSAIVLAFWLWLGLQVPLMLSGVWYENRPWSLFWINAGHRLVALIAMAIVLGLWV